MAVHDRRSALLSTLFREAKTLFGRELFADEGYRNRQGPRENGKAEDFWRPLRNRLNTYHPYKETLYALSSSLSLCVRIFMCAYTVLHLYISKQAYSISPDKGELRALSY